MSNEYIHVWRFVKIGKLIELQTKLFLTKISQCSRVIWQWIKSKWNDDGKYAHTLLYLQEC